MGWTLKAIYLGCTCSVQSFSSDSSSLRDQSLVTGAPGGLLTELSLLGTSSAAAASGNVPQSESTGSPDVRSLCAVRVWWNPNEGCHCTTGSWGLLE